jgi:hypothetical protein
MAPTKRDTHRRPDDHWVPLSSMTAHMWAIEQMAADRDTDRRRRPRLISLIFGMFIR